MSEIFILHLSREEEKLWNKLVNLSEKKLQREDT